jgi:hypothetical protein
MFGTISPGETNPGFHTNINFGDSQALSALEMMLKARSLKYTQNVRILAHSLSIKFHCVLLVVRISSPQNKKKQILVTNYNYAIQIMLEALFESKNI